MYLTHSVHILAPFCVKVGPGLSFPIFSLEGGQVRLAMFVAVVLFCTLSFCMEASGANTVYGFKHAKVTVAIFVRYTFEVNEYPIVRLADSLIERQSLNQKQLW